VRPQARNRHRVVAAVRRVRCFAFGFLIEPGLFAPTTMGAAEIGALMAAMSSTGPNQPHAAKVEYRRRISSNARTGCAR
jgi:hypothetical protein